MTIKKEAVSAVLARRGVYDTAETYYQGDVPEVFATAKVRRAMRSTGDFSRLNYCRPVVEAVNDRLEIARISGDTKAANAKIEEIWRNNDLDIESVEVHRNALVMGDAYVIAWPGEDGQMELALNDARSTAIVYQRENPRKKAYGVKVWLADESTTRMNLYYADRIEKWSANTDSISEGTNWTHLENVDNPFGEVPVFHFRTHRPFGRPEHYDAYAAQNAINKLFITNMFTIDYQGAPQRYALAAANDTEASELEDFKEDDTARENIRSLKSEPGGLWFMKGITQMGEFKPADSDVFWKPIEELRNTIASTTHTPAHYLSRGSYNPTGQSLRVAESPLLKKVSDRQISFGQTWREIFRFCLKVEGIVSDAMVYWKAKESLDETERWDVTLKKINSGLSHRQALREGGYPEDQIEQIIAERLQEMQEGLMYSRADGSMDRVPQTRVQPQNDDTTPKDLGTGKDN
jgi:hypothetical protein